MPYDILLVDDNKEYRDEFRECFLDYNVIEASSAEEAIKILKKPNEIDLVILDERMPGKTGIEALGEIKKANPILSVIMLTGHGSEDTAMKALRGHADDYLRKSLPFGEIEQRIREIVESKKKPGVPDRGGVKDKIERMKYFALKNYHMNIHLNDLAVKLFLSPKYLSKLFKETTGMTFNQYKIGVKIEKAKELLESKDYNIYQVAEKVGYQNAESFIRVFERQTGFTPTEYRDYIKGAKEQRINKESVKGLQVRDKKSLYKKMRQQEGQLKETRKELKKIKPLAEIGEKTAFLTHEMRSPLGTIQAAIYNIKKKRKAKAIDNDIEKIEKLVSEADQLIDDTLAYAHTRKPRYKKVDINLLLDESIASLESMIRNKGISLIKRQSLPSQTYIEADPIQLKQIFVNIIKNACQAVAEKIGSIIIESGPKEEDFITIDFKDNGEGIEKKDLDRITKPFFTKKPKGTGLGLTLCNKIIKLHGGSMHINSVKGQGTTVSVILPTHAAV